MLLAPAQKVKDTGWIGLLQLTQFCIDILLRFAAEFAVTGELIHIIVHGGDVSSNQLIDAPVFLILNLELLTDAGLGRFVLLEHLNHLGGARTDDPVHG